MRGIDRREATYDREDAQTMSDPIQEKILEIIVEKLGVDKEQVKESSTYQEDLNADSLDIAELVMALEEEFELSVPEEAQILTVSETIEFVKKELEKKGAG